MWGHVYIAQVCMPFPGADDMWLWYLLFGWFQCSAWHQFMCDHTPTSDVSPNCILKYYCSLPAKYGGSSTIISNFHPNPCARRTYSKMGCILNAHSFGWQIRVFGSSTSVFRPQSCQIAHVRWAYRLLRERTVLKKFSKNSLSIKSFLEF